MDHQLPVEVENWLRSIDAHGEAGDRVGMFWDHFQKTTGCSEASALQATLTWMMIAYGWPTGMPMPGLSRDE